jgi:hypothetical protein
MESTMTAFEVSGQVDEQRQLHIDSPLPISGPRRVRVIVLFSADDDFDEAEWLYSAATNSAFDFLKDAAEDIYSASDGVPFHDEA